VQPTRGKNIKIEIAPIASPQDIAVTELRERAEGALCSVARQYVASIDGRVVGFLSFDDRPAFEAGVIYEIFVLSAFRRQGVATILLEFGERLARATGYRRVKLFPKSLDDEMSDAQLAQWYERRGYVVMANGEMEKVFG
jgi:GNAT superfamily N-acetyltransferase